MLIIIADDSSASADKAANHLIRSISSFAHLLLKQKGGVLKMCHGTGIEHFGYADGISQPLYLKDEITSQSSTREWNDETPLLRLLVEDHGLAPDSFGSFFVFRKLDQNVKDFNIAEDSLPQVQDVIGKKNKDLPGAMLVGRFENSQPVTKSSDGFMPNPPRITNDFDYKDDKDGLKCPFHAHIRVMNPRNGGSQDVAAQRITRRGIPYDDAGRFTEGQMRNLTEEILDANQPTKDVGLLFMCYQSNIDTQFLILQSLWANTGIILNDDLQGQDSIIGQGSNPAKRFPKKWNSGPQTKKFVFPKFVSNRGGEYFFTPSISFLKNLYSQKKVKSVKAG